MTKFKEPFIKGFVTIESDIKLEVVAVYTAGDDKGIVRSIDVEHIPAARIGTTDRPVPKIK